uniref:Uncharacterized protein n=1 Tax=Anopheles farauti TaxID=69004 RepID=A0A182QGU9_9DIPT
MALTVGPAERVEKLHRRFGFYYASCYLVGFMVGAATAGAAAAGAAACMKLDKTRRNRPGDSVCKRARHIVRCILRHGRKTAAGNAHRPGRTKDEPAESAPKGEQNVTNKTREKERYEKHAAR